MSPVRQTHPPSARLLYYLPSPPTPTPTITSTPTYYLQPQPQPRLSPRPQPQLTQQQTTVSLPSTARASLLHQILAPRIFYSLHATLLFLPATRPTRTTHADQDSLLPISLPYIPSRQSGQLHIPNTAVSLTAYVFADTDLAENLFGLASLINLGYTATYSRTGITIDNSYHHTAIYGTKHPNANVW